LRQVELLRKATRRVLPVHRLDREAAGLVLVAHDRAAAARLSDLFRSRAVQKRYRIVVRGNPAAGLPSGRIERPLDGRPALTHVTHQAYDPTSDTSVLEVRTATGRKHQIRRHLALVGHPVMGDPRYGTGNKNLTGLQLAAVGLTFTCPFTRREVRVDLPPEPAPPPEPGSLAARHGPSAT
jgi:tRNA pseudouridine32 synthase/23S rRNA pseudouridine746 synthase